PRWEHGRVALSLAPHPDPALSLAPHSARRRPPVLALLAGAGPAAADWLVRVPRWRGSAPGPGPLTRRVRRTASTSATGGGRRDTHIRTQGGPRSFPSGGREGLTCKSTTNLSTTNLPGGASRAMARPTWRTSSG